MSDSLFQHPALFAVDPEMAAAIEAEEKRQEEHLELIASENHCPAAVLDAMGSVLTDKYAEGYPGNRHYAGCECVDVVERIAIARVKKLFNAEHANVQPHSGSQANMAVYNAVLQSGSRILSMAFAHGGHLTHGHSRNFSGQLYEVVSYGVNENGLIDYSKVHELACQHNPALIVAGASAYSRIIDFEAFRAIADEVGAYLMADIAHIAGLVAAGLHPSPVPHADFVTSTTHKTLRGPRGAFVLCRQEHAARLDSAVMPGIQGGPMMHVIAAKAVAFGLAMQPEFRAYQEHIVANARAMAREFQEKGLPVVSGGTDTHMFLLDLSETGYNGQQACDLLAEANITANRNAIPNDPRRPGEASGIRIGTPALTSRGLGQEEVRAVARHIVTILRSDDPVETARRIKPQVLDLCRQFPVRH
ncbi:MAG: serine hydroxymethyltransferase [Planctomycetes bacterium]|nr:serine hydroxymethyltransferase [Planctomycetota bacterium]